MKAKVPELLEIYKARWFGFYWGATVWRIAFGNQGKLPTGRDHKILVDDSGTKSIVIYLRPAVPPVKHRSRGHHRVYVKCPRCGNQIPAGRIHQHTC